jgi:hypothetical protein
MNIDQIVRSLNIPQENKPKIEEIHKYMNDHRVQELFNVYYHGFKLIEYRKS